MVVRQAVLPVAGLGTRFLPATKAIPKEMLPIVDKPLIQYAVEEIMAAGIERIIVVTSRGKGALEDHFDSTPELEETLRRRGQTGLLERLARLEPFAGRIFSVRQPRPMGLGHAVWCARDLVGDEPFAVLLPDDLFLANPPVLKQMVDRFAQEQCSLAAVMEVPREETKRYGILDVVRVDGDLVRIRGLVEKPEPASAPSCYGIAGRYILTPEIFTFLEKGGKGAGGEIQLTDAMMGLLSRECIAGFLFQGIRFDCGDVAGFQMANVAMALERPELRARLLPFLKGVVARNVD